MNVKLLLVELKQFGIKVQAKDGKLNIQSSVSPIPAEAIAKLKQHKAELLAYFEQQAQPSKPAIAPISAADKMAGRVISSQQIALWPLYQLSQSASYNIPLCYNLIGELDIDRLNKALTLLYRTSDSLSSVFVERADQVYIVPHVDDNWQLLNVSGTEADVAHQYQLEQQREFDLTSGPLFVARLIQLEPQQAVLILNFPHIIIDGWSIDLLWQRIVEVYQGGDCDQNLLDFYDFLTSEQPAQQPQIAYWQQRLQGYEPVTLHSVSAVTREQNHLHYHSLSQADVAAIAEHAEQAEVSVFTATLQLWGKALAQYVGQSEVVISTPYANREQWTSVIGYFVSMLPIRIEQGQCLGDFQQQLHRDFAAAQCDFNSILPSLGLQTTAGRHPLQQAVFSWLDGLNEQPDLATVAVERRAVTTAKAKFPLSLTISPSEAEYQLKWEFDPTVLSVESIDLLHQLLLAQIRQQNSILPQMPPTIAQPNSVLTRLATQLDRAPQAIAVRYAEQQLSYQQLWQQAQQLAAYLQQQGVVAGDRVAVCFPRSTDLAIAILGIVMAGAVYVPIAKVESAARLEELANIGQFKHCISEQLQIQGVAVHSMAMIVAAGPLPYQGVALNGESPIYINFSSGTTGKPKGILCMHQGVSRLVDNPNYMQLDHNTQMLCAAAQTFDAFTLEFWGPLLNGGCVHLLAAEQLDNLILSTMIRQQGINTVWLTAALYHTLVDIDVKAFSGLAQLLVGGDVVSPKHVNAVYAIDRDIKIINCYGPTENTTFSSCYLVDRSWPSEESLPIGYSIKGTQIHILDTQQQPLEVGCIGEIVVTGLGLAAGYINHTGGGFIQLPAPNQHIRAYCTGDLGYIDSEGRLRFVGRSDQQVKINGFRVELETINRALNNLAGIEQGITLAIRKDQRVQLVGFVSLQQSSQQQLANNQIKADLANSLPSFMIPELILQVEQIPSTTAGKVDRNQLMQIHTQWQQQSQHGARALTELEQKIAEVWQRVLACEVTAASANFYQMGGNSLLALKVINELRQDLVLPVQLLDLIQNPILEQFAQHLMTLVQDDEQQHVTLSAADKSIGVMASVQQQSLWPLYLSKAASNYNITLCFDLKGEFNGPGLQQALNRVYHQFDSLHCNFAEVDGHLVMRLNPQADWCANVITADENAVQQLLIQESERDFDLRNDCLFVAHLIEVEQQHTVLILNFPHITMDGMSVMLLFKALTEAYQTGKIHNASSDFCDYLVNQPAAGQHNDYWQQRLQGYQLLQWHSLSEAKPQAHFQINYQLAEQDTLLLQQLSQRHKVSMFAVTIQMWGKALAQYLGQQEVVISTPYANREQWNTVIGYMVSMLPLRIEQSQDVVDFQQQLHRDMAAAQCDLNQLLPELGLHTDSGRHPLQQAVFSWLDGVEVKPEFAGVEVDTRTVKAATAKFPLSLTVAPSGAEYRLQWEFDSSIFSADSIELLYQLFVAQIRQQRQAWPKLPATVVESSSVLTRLAAQLDRAPQAIAVRCAERQLSYQQLWQQSQHLAGYLQQQGVVAGDSIGVCLPRNTDLAIAIVGIVMAGGVYVPISPDESATRLAELAAITEMKLCISEQLQINAVDVHSMVVLAEAIQPHYQAVSLDGESLIYINFSSGTTGKPKAIACVHQGVSRLVDDPDFIQLDQNTQMLCAAAQTFDAFTLEFWGPLLNGGCIHFLATEQLDNASLSTMIRQQGVNTVWLTAALFHTLVDIDVSAFSGLAQLLVGGDVVSPKHVGAVYENEPNITIINGYGPTENTTFTSCYPIDKNWPYAQALPIGYSIKGTQVHLLDAERLPVPTGCIGEIVVTGLGLAAGYLNQVSGGFIHLPSPNQHIRAYCTGDLGYIDTEGRLRLIGRADQQVKMNGFRIELEAIDRALNCLPQIHATASLMIKQGQGNALISFVHAADSQVEKDALIYTLAETLPSYMVPNDIVFVKQLPMTKNGKVNRSQLVDNYSQYRQQQLKQGRALTELETQVADIWSSILDCEVLSATDNFYRLGGNSVMLLLCQKQLFQQFNKTIDLQYLLKYQMLEQFCQCLQQQLATTEQANTAVDTVTDGFQSATPLSDGQQRLYSLHQSQPTSAYNVPFFFELPEESTEAEIEKTVQQLLQQQPILWVKFIELDQQVMQLSRGLQGFQLPIQRIDTDQLDTVYQREAQRVFQLTESSSFFSLINVGARRKILLFNVHHLCFDGGSLPQVLRSLNQSLSGVEPMPTACYQAYAHWQQTAQYQQLLSDDLAYWQQQLVGVSQDTAIPANVFQQELSQNAAHYRCSLTQQQLLRVKALVRQQAVTDYSFWMSVFNLVLSRVLDQAEIVVAMPVANRTDVSFQDTIGFFANTLLLRSEVAQDGTFVDYLQDFHCNLTEGLVHQNVSLIQLVEALGVTTAAGKMPLTQVLFSMTDSQQDTSQPNRIKVHTGSNSTTKYDFFFTLAHGIESSAIEVEYNKSLYTESLVESFVTAFIAVVDQVLQHQQIQLQQITIHSESESVQSTFTTKHTVIDRILEQVVLKPQRIALQSGSDTISYDELLNRVIRTASAMAELGVERQDRVAIYTERNIDLPIYLLAVMYLGASYVPLDKNYPAQRTAYVIDNARPKLIVKHDDFTLPPLQIEAEVIQVSQLFNMTQQLEITPMPQRCQLDDLAYIIYTSGSTGEPKGVSIRHLGVAQLYHWAQMTYSNEDFAMVYAGTSVCFDLSVFELFVTLAMGGSVYVAETQIALADDLPFVPVTMVNTVPSVFGSLLDSLVDHSSIRVVNLAGEIFHPDLAQQIKAKLPQVKLFNLYGPSEDTTYSTFYQITEDVPERVKIGQAVPGTQAVVMDKVGRKMARHFSGELYLSGCGLAAGYFNNPQKTVDSFVTCEADQKLYYKTGDLVRLDEQGHLEYIGRIDNQVKLRGYRIELSEIEACLNGIEQIVQSQVLVLDAHHLVAFYTASGDADVISWKAALLSKLPSYMLPEHWIELEAFPMTPSGKINRKQLADYSMAEQLSEQPTLELCEIGLQLLQLWQQVTGDSNPNVKLNQGASSLLMVVFRHKVEKAFNVKLSLAKIHVFQTIQQLSQYIATLQSEQTLSVSGAQSINEGYLSQLVDSHDAPGASISLYQDGNFSSYGIGYRDQQQQMPMTTDTRFRVVCFNKVIIASLVMVLDSKGLLNINSKVNDMYPDLFARGLAEDQQIRLIHLLNHTAGLDESNLAAIYATSDSLEQVIAKACKLPQHFTPGQRFVYSSFSGMLVAFLIEHVMKQPWKQVLTVHLFEPLGIDSHIEKHSSSYVRGGNNQLEACAAPSHPDFIEPVASAQVMLTANELMRLTFMVFNAGQALDGKQLIISSNAEFMMQKNIDISTVHYLSGWACGWLCFPSDDLIGFLTGEAGQETVICCSKSRKKILIVQANFYPSLSLFEELVAKVFDTSLLPQRKVASGVQLANAVGRYAADGAEVEIGCEDNKYYCHFRQKDPKGKFMTTISGEIKNSGMGDFYIPNSQHPMNDALHFEDLDEYGVPQIVRIPSKICKRVE